MPGDSELLSELQNQITSLQDQVAQFASKQVQQKSFPWDTLILVIATTITGLSISDVVVGFLTPDSSKVVCFVPQSNGLDRDQVQYVNEFCHHALPISVNLTIALFVQGLLLVAFHFMWKLIVSGRIESYYSHVATMETLRDRKTGKYPDKNFEIAEFTQRQFGGKKFIVFSYFLKLLAQLLVIIGAVLVNVLVFEADSKFGIIFGCEDDVLGPLFENVTCSYSRFQYLSILSVVDYILLGVSILVIVYGIVVSVLKIKFNVNKDSAIFSYQSGIDSEFYVARFGQFKWFRCNDDLNLLLSNLFSTNAGFGKVLKSVQIESDLSDIFDSHLELPIAKAAEMAESGETDQRAETDQEATTSTGTYTTRNIMFVSNICLGKSS